MTGLVNLLVLLSVIVIVVRRQLKPRRLDTERRFWLIPLVLAVLALRDPHLVDTAHRTVSIALLSASLLVTLAMGAVWGWTGKVWRKPDGTVWTKGTKATIAAWSGMIAVRLGLYGLGAALHLRQSTSVLLLSLGALLLVRGLVVNWRARNLETSPAAPVAG
ncbi:hypothetical protein GCM10010193_05980 [Kitasatospora atroaurantiaca]|uniref:Uncharacterized protein DUF1453 n=1 Tax=Kitasatospora atroaurantiaca TaxID=285545 RepID=A0A561EWD6_9ACTN|nr:CcdC protein domain-containing protein [Kitasatospora atroaurantiaca]TWE19903.1 uncharacterized protein DUF1453 [Kitasatospora atroaurantiaca]